MGPQCYFNSECYAALGNSLLLSRLSRFWAFLKWDYVKSFYLDELNEGKGISLIPFEWWILCLLGSWPNFNRKLLSSYVGFEAVTENIL